MNWRCPLDPPYGYSSSGSGGPGDKLSGLVSVGNFSVLDSGFVIGGALVGSRLGGKVRKGILSPLPVSASSITPSVKPPKFSRSRNVLSTTATSPPATPGVSST